jgi:hypothetical protein
VHDLLLGWAGQEGCSKGSAALAYMWLTAMGMAGCVSVWYDVASSTGLNLCVMGVGGVAILSEAGSSAGAKLTAMQQQGGWQQHVQLQGSPAAAAACGA